MCSFPVVLRDFIPVLKENALQIFDTEHPEKLENMSPILESERRLFYVGITRAKKALHLSTITPNNLQKSGPLPSRFLEEADIETCKQLLENLHEAKRWPETQMVKWKQAVLQIKSKSFLTNLEKYLENLALHELKNYVNRIQENIKEEAPFQYKYSYDRSQNKTVAKVEEPSPNPWDEVEMF